MLEWLENVDDKYIEEANPKNKSIAKFRWNPIAIAACLALVVLTEIGSGFYRQITEKEKYYSTNMEEILAIYEGELLAERLSQEGVVNTNIQLCYAGEGLPGSVEDWKTLSVSANYEDCDVTLNCGFNGETFAVNEDNVIDSIQYGDTPVLIYKAEIVDEYELAYYAVFEYQNVCYELRMYSNDKDDIYDILQAILGAPENDTENISGGQHNFTEVLGYNDYYVKVEQNMPGFIIQKYYATVNGVETCIAEVFGYAVPGPEVYSKDLNGDGVSELICNCMAGTGAERVYIYRNNSGVIEKGRLAYDLWDEEVFPGITNRGSAYILEKYIAENDTFEISYPTENDMETIVLENMDMFEFGEFVEES